MPVKTIVILLIALAISACSTGSRPGAVSNVDTALGGEGGEEEIVDDRRPSQFSAFAEDLVKDLENLQLAVDMRVEEEVEVCMQKSGFEFEKKSIDFLRESLYMDQNTQFRLVNLPREALDRLTVEAPTLEDHPILGNLSSEEQIAWLETRNSCYVTLSQKYINPLQGDEGDWYQQLSDEASSRVISDPRIGHAKAESNKCVTSAGYSTNFQAQDEYIFQRLDTLLEEVEQGDPSRREIAISQLEELAREQDGYIETLEICLSPVIDLEEKLFVEMSNNLISDKEAEAAIWISSLEEKMSTFSEQLVALREN